MTFGLKVGNEFIDGQSGLNAVIDVFPVKNALIKRFVTTLVWNTEMLDILSLDLHVKAAAALVDSHVQYHIVSVRVLSFLLYQLIDLLVYLS